jgi:acetoin utilization protein AcuC
MSDCAFTDFRNPDAVTGGFDPQRSLIVLSDIYRRAAYGRSHPLAIARVETVSDLCADLGWLAGRVRPSPIAEEVLLIRYHDPAYVAALRQADESGTVAADVRVRFGFGTMENPLFAGVFARASTAVGGSYEAARLARDGRVVFHPAGGTHHAGRDRASGFCYFNDPVFAVLGFLDTGLTRVAVVDIDAHHGDGVENAFAADPRVMTVSLHEENRWPFTGLLANRREGRARNIPLPRGINDAEYSHLIDRAVMPVVRAFEPEAVVIVCGADTVTGDPLSTMCLSNVCVWHTVETLCGLAPRVVVVGGGGYNAWTLARLWTGLWGRLAGFPIPDVLPAASQARLARLTCDLVDDEDHDPAWLSTLADPPNLGPVRAVIADLVAATLAPFAASGDARSGQSRSASTIMSNHEYKNIMM